MLVLYDGATSVCAVKARLVLAEKNLAFESRTLDLRAGDQFGSDYLAINPNAVVPTLIDGEETIIESSVIMQYLEDLRPDPTLLPGSPANRARMRLWLKRIDDPLHPATGTLTHATAFRPGFLKLDAEQQRAWFEKIPDPARRARQEAVYRDGLDAPIVVKAVKTFDRFLADMETALTENDWLTGRDYSLADAAATPYVNRLAALTLLDVWAGALPAVMGWYARIRDRPSFKAAVTDYLTERDISYFANIDAGVSEQVRHLLKT